MKAASSMGAILKIYMRDVDRTLLRENLKLTPAQRLDKLARFSSFASTLRQAGEKGSVLSNDTKALFSRPNLPPMTLW